MQTSERTQQLALTAAQLALLGCLGWLVLAYDTGTRPDYNFRVVSLLAVVSSPLMLAIMGQVIVRHNRTLFAWGYSVGLPALLAVAISYGRQLLEAATPAAAALMAGPATPTIFRREALLRLRVETGMANMLLLYGLSVSALVMIVVVSRRANKRQGVIRLGARFSASKQVALVGLLFSLGAAVQLWYYQQSLRLTIAKYYLELYKHPAAVEGVDVTRK